MSQLTEEVEELQSREAVLTKKITKSASAQTETAISNFSKNISTQIDNQRLTEDEESTQKTICELKVSKKRQKVYSET